jgi:hypothetical protein
MTNPAEPSTPSGSSEKSTTKATDHELQKYDIFTRYGQAPIKGITDCARAAARWFVDAAGQGMACRAC